MTNKATVLATFGGLGVITAILLCIPERYRDAAFDLLACAFGLFFVAWILSYFAFHRYKPVSRAALTVGVAYLLSVTLLELLGGVGVWRRSSVPLAFAPGAIMAFAYYQLAFRRAWIEESGATSAGIEIADPKAERAQGIALLIGCLSFVLLLAVASFAGGLGRIIAASLFKVSQ
jgi:hypothetical protein